MFSAWAFYTNNCSNWIEIVSARINFVSDYGEPQREELITPANSNFLTRSGHSLSN
jgi:hypothetical protein